MQDEEFAQDPILQKQVEDVQDFFSLAELTVCINYPASAKFYLREHYSVPLSTYCRKFKPQPVFSEQDQIRIEAMFRSQRKLSHRLNIAEHQPKVPPPT